MDLLENGDQVKLEMFRCLHDNIIFARKDNEGSQDSIQLTKITVQDGKLLNIIPEIISAPYVGEILSLELDPLLTTDVESYSQDSSECTDKSDRIFVIDSRMNLLLFETKGRSC